MLDDDSQSKHDGMKELEELEKLEEAWSQETIKNDENIKTRYNHENSVAPEFDGFEETQQVDAEQDPEIITSVLEKIHSSGTLRTSEVITPVASDIALKDEQTVALPATSAPVPMPQNAPSSIPTTAKKYVDMQQPKAKHEDMSSYGFSIGQILRNQYKIVREIGQGGMGRVYEGEDLPLKRRVAIKTLLPNGDKIDFAKQCEQFQQEAEICAQLDHPNIVHVYNVGVEKNIPYMVMEYIEGVSISEYVKEHGVEDWQLQAKLIKKIARGLVCVHNAKLLHRDIKPTNILVKNDGEPVLIDFGIAQKAQENTSDSQENVMLGTVRYMTPEQVDTNLGSVDARSDIYSLGMVFYELLTNQEVYHGSMTNIVYKMLYSEPAKPTQVNPRIPKELEKIVLRAIQKDQTKRFQNAQEFVDALNKYYISNIQYQVMDYMKKQKKVFIAVIACLFLVVCSLIFKYFHSEQKISQQSTQLDTLSQSLEESQGIEGFKYLGEKKYICGNPQESLSAHCIAEYMHIATGIKFVLIPGGKFSMGSDVEDSEDSSDAQPVHTVEIPEFLMAQYECTQEEWERVMGTNPSSMKDPKNPVNRINWKDCQDFCTKTGLSLPSEAQWEYACRGGNPTQYTWGNDKTTADEYIWYKDNCNHTIHMVGQKKPNAFGLYDMNGNVSEWCEDGWEEGYEVPRTYKPYIPEDDDEDIDRVVRGGSFKDKVDICTSAYRNYRSPNVPTNYIGVRFVYAISQNKNKGEQKREERQKIESLGFEYLGNYNYTCGYRTYNISSYKHNVTGIEFVLLPSGEFKMGSEVEERDAKPIHTVKIPHSFLMAKYECTQKQWREIVGTEPWKDDPDVVQQDDYPASCIAWEDCKRFYFIDEKTGLSLPSEAQWEYACRGGNATKYCFGDELQQLQDYAWYDENSEYILHKCGEKLPNAFGLYDMHGNVAEWCGDEWKDNYKTPRTIMPYLNADRYQEIDRVFRGGSVTLDDTSCTSSFRDCHSETFKQNDFGIRFIFYIHPEDIENAIAKKHAVLGKIEKQNKQEEKIEQKPENKPEQKPAKTTESEQKNQTQKSSIKETKMQDPTKAPEKKVKKRIIKKVKNS